MRNHAKFLAVDHRFLLISSANFSWSAEHGNVELGVLVDNVNLTQAIEYQLRRVEGPCTNGLTGIREERPRQPAAARLDPAPRRTGPIFIGSVRT